MFECGRCWRFISEGEQCVVFNSEGRQGYIELYTCWGSLDAPNLFFLAINTIDVYS